MGFSTTTARPAPTAAIVSGACTAVPVATTTRSWSDALSHRSCAVPSTATPGRSAAAWARRLGSAVTTLVSSRPGVAAMSGA